ncbi:MAG TPA: hypothetical protein ENN23_02880 [Deltaproteobacteria bacterium]|nr:hypothetical protein [Deltaproteobacteria bacterium]
MREKMFQYINIIVICIGFYILFIFLFSRSTVDYDIWGYLSFGRVYWEEGYFPYQDIFAYTPTKPLWVYHEWLTGVILYPILKYLGPAGIQLFRYTFIVLTIYIMYLVAIKKGGTPLVSLVCISVGLILMSWGYTPVMRAQIFTYLFFPLSVYILETARKDKKWLALLWVLPIQILWCNLHGGFLAGLGLIVLYALGDGLSGKKFFPFVITFIAASLVNLINPYGFEYWMYIIEAVSMPRPGISEWFSVITYLQLKNYVIPSVIFIAVSIFSLLVLILHGKKYLTELVIFTAVICLGYKHIRHTIFLGLVFGMFMPGILSGMKEVATKKWPLMRRITWVTPILLVFFYFPANYFLSKKPYVSASVLPTFSISAPRSIFPVGALEWMGENYFEGNILSLFQWGQYIIWSTHPKCKVAMDGRYETIYPEHVQKEYFDFANGRDGWRIFLNKYPHDAVLIMAKTKIHLLMLKEPLWEKVYSDGLCVLFIRKDRKEKSVNK